MAGASKSSLHKKKKADPLSLYFYIEKYRDIWPESSNVFHISRKKKKKKKMDFLLVRTLKLRREEFVSQSAAGRVLLVRSCGNIGPVIQSRRVESGRERPRAAG